MLRVTTAVFVYAAIVAVVMLLFFLVLAVPVVYALLNRSS
jgi:hypothetical protein